MDFSRTLDENVASLSHDAYKRDYGIIVTRTLSMSRLKSLLIGEEGINIKDENDKKLVDGIISVHFHLHPSVEYTKTEDSIILNVKREKKLLFTSLNGRMYLSKSTYIGNFFEPQLTCKVVIEDNIQNSGGILKWRLEELIN